MNNNENNTSISKAKTALTKVKIVLVALAVLVAIVYLGGRHIYKLSLISADSDVGPKLEKKFAFDTASTERDGDELNISKSVPYNLIEDIEISITNANLIVESSTSENIDVAISGRTKDEFDVSVKDDKLQITQKGNLSFSVFFDESVKVAITIPTQYHNNLSLKQGSGSSRVRQISIDEAKIHCSSGSIDLEDTSFESFQLKVASGKFQGTGVTSDNSELKLSSGSIDLSGDLGPSEIDISSGNIQLEYTQQPTDIDIKCSSGSVKIDLPDDGDFSLSSSITSGSLINELTENENSSNEISVRLTSGNVVLY